MTPHFNRASRTGMRRAARTLGGTGWVKQPGGGGGKWFHPQTGLRR